jgi:hypothetical protein
MTEKNVWFKNPPTVKPERREASAPIVEHYWDGQPDYGR